jgi:hypothetical protein
MRQGMLDQCDYLLVKKEIFFMDFMLCVPSIAMPG